LTTTATSYHTPVSSKISVPIKEYLEKHKSPSMTVQEQTIEIKPEENVNFNSANTEKLRSCELFNEKLNLTKSIFVSKGSIKDEKSNSVKKKFSQINHHPNMLADCD